MALMRALQRYRAQIAASIVATMVAPSPVLIDRSVVPPMVLVLMEEDVILLWVPLLLGGDGGQPGVVLMKVEDILLC